VDMPCVVGGVRQQASQAWLR